MPRLYIIRGASGSGKSTFASKLGCVVFEADQYFVVNGEYEWSANKIKHAHQFCNYMVTQAMIYGVDIAVSNTNTRCWEFEKYIEFAKTYNYDVQVYRCTGNYENTHGVPTETVQNMKDRFEDFEGEIFV